MDASSIPTNSRLISHVRSNQCFVCVLALPERPSEVFKNSKIPNLDLLRVVQFVEQRHLPLLPRLLGQVTSLLQQLRYFLL
jgi:hypothetical protein